MAHLTKPAIYDIKDSNIALLGSDLEKRVREHAGDTESAWTDAGTSLGLQIWRIEKFHLVPWPADRAGSFYDGDSYIVLHTYKKTPKAESFSYDLHFWLGENTTQDEAGTAAYKTVELDDHLHGKPVQYREVQGYETPRFISYFPKLVILKGGVATGFHHVSAPPPLNIKKLYQITHTRVSEGRSHLVVREVAAQAASLVEGDTYVLDKGSHILQFNTKSSVGQEKYRAAEFVQSLVSQRQGQCEVTVYDEGSSGAGSFLAEFGLGTQLRPVEIKPVGPIALFLLSDASGKIVFKKIAHANRASLSSDDVFLVDLSSNAYPAIYIWIGKKASLNEKRLALHYAQVYLHDKAKESSNIVVPVSIPVIKMEEGSETETFAQAFA